MVTLESILQKVMTHVSDTAAVKAVKLALGREAMRRDLSKTVEVRILNTLVCGGIEIGPPAHQCEFHLYYSVHDHKIKDVIDKMRAELKVGAKLRVTCNGAKFDCAHQMIVFLNSETNFSDDNKLLAELRRGLNKCVHAGRDPATYFVLVHETRWLRFNLGMQDNVQHVPVVRGTVHASLLGR